MFLRKQFLLLISLALFLAACQSGQVGEQRPFTRYNYFDFEAEVARLAVQKPMVEKTVLSNGEAQTEVDTIYWPRELALFVNSDINNARSKDRYEVNVAEGQLEGDRVVTYTAINDNEKVQLMEQTFTNNRCSKVYVKRGVESRFQESWQELTYEPGLGYRIIGHQNVELAFESALEVVGRFVNQSHRWRGSIQLREGQVLPLVFELYTEADNPRMIIHNGDERIEANEVVLKGDSIRVKLPVFLSTIKGVVHNNSIEGSWHNEAKGPDYVLPFTAKRSSAPRFASNGEPTDFSGKWEVDFSPGEEVCKAIGMFEQNGSHVTGTFITETGDYRFLEGAVSGDSLLLSTFDGAHAFLFKAAMNEDQLSGQFWSGKHWLEPWTAVRNPEFELANPESLTYLVDENERFDFLVQDRDGNVVSLTDERFKDKVTIVQIIGSWCPNCMDETAYLANLHRNYASEGLEVVALCFEKHGDDPTAAYKGMDRMKAHFNAGYDFYLAGDASKAEACEVFPMLNEISSFPTTVFLDRKGEVRKIHTGFYGPGTGDYYNRFVESTDEFVRALLMEKPA